MMPEISCISPSLTESLNALEDTDLDALMSDLVADISEVEKATFQEQKDASHFQRAAKTQAPANASVTTYAQSSFPNIAVTQVEDDLPPPPPELAFGFPPPPPPAPTQPPEPCTQVSRICCGLKLAAVSLIRKELSQHESAAYNELAKPA